MKKIKGCLQEDCVKKKIVYKMDENFCTRCGQGLYYVCRKCKATVIDEHGESVLCIRCQAEIDDGKQKIMDATKKVGSAVLSTAMGVGKAVKSTIKKK